MKLKFSTNPTLFYTIIIFILLHPQPSSTYQTGNISVSHFSKVNLEYASEELTSCGNCFDDQIKSWSASKLVDSTKYSYTCNGACLLGGYNILGPSGASTAGQYFQKTFTDLPSSHTAVYISFTMYEIDSPDAVDYVQVTVDTQSFSTYGRAYSTTGLPNICGNPAYPTYTETPNDRLFIKMPHSLSTLTLTFTMRNNEPSTNESWGFKDIRILFVTTSATISTTMCMISPAGAGTGYACLCQEGYYDTSGNGNGPCQQCDSACSSCFGSSADTCYQCASGYGFDGTQCVKCDLSCSVCHGSAANQCDVCPSGQLLLNRETCQDPTVCVSPLAVTTDACSNSYCDNPCYPSQYLLTNGNCRATCDSPLRKKAGIVGKHCLMPCDDPLQFYHVENGKCDYECDTWVSIPEGLYLACMPPPYSISRLLHYVRYLNIEMPDRLQNLTLKRENNILSLRVAPKMFKNVRRGFVKIPGYFSISPYLSTSFFVNFSDDLILLGTVLTFGLGFLLIELFFKILNRFPKMEFIFERFRMLTLWNIPIMLVLVNTGDIIFFAVLEFRSYHYEYSKAGFSLTMGIIMFIIVIILLLASVGFSCVAYSIKATGPVNVLSKRYVRFASTWQTVQVLFRGFKGTNGFYQAFYPLYCLRIALPMIFSAGMYDDPLAQVILDLCINAFMILYLVFVRPLKVKADLVNLILLEMIFLVANISCLVLVILHLNKTEGDGARIVFGDIILGCEIAIHVLSISAMCVKLGLTAREAYTEKTKKSGNDKTIWLQLLFIPLQQGCFGFEQVQMDRFSDAGAKDAEKSSQRRAHKGPNKVADSSKLQTMFRNSMMNFRGTESDFGQASGAFPIHKISDKALMDRTMMTIESNHTLRDHPASSLNISVGRSNHNSSQFLGNPRRERRSQKSFRGFNDRNDTFYQTDASLFDQPSAFRTERSGFL